ncbi:CAF17-like 4Fe-4S cluster assembly/insertion protein YgfZ [Nocardioides daeguensis]|uniref:Folate-binding protein YgfZ n=1 Tax=Nocardioides daeguensis TaxID=908359 RepID=A0ABP6V9E1_9ACTN|nr:folate-binding protein [Nocardioides daeguensis]MBV6726183.1 folate-binding protein [Nocardioides daeguensis]MCR1772026.1 folate-binding protein [Nocardioides daeguensis]
MTTQPTRTSPLLDLPGAVAGEGIDAGVAAHYGSLYGEQRALAAGEGFVDLSHRDVLRVAGPDRLTWLHSLTTQYFEGLQPGRWVSALVLSPQGHVEHAFTGVDDGEAFTAHTEPGRAAALIGFLERMRFMMRVEITDVTADLAVAWRPAPVVEVRGALATSAAPVVEVRGALATSLETPGARPARYDLVPRDQLSSYAAAAGPAAGLWAFEALRIERGEPRFGIDTDERTIPNEVGWIADRPWGAVHLDKGCYRGQETVARVHNLGKPPRRLTLLHLDGSENRLPAPGAEVRDGRVAAEERGGVSRPLGVVGSSARHHELGPIALALLKRNTEVSAPLVVDGLPAAQEVVVDPEVGLHFRPAR